MKVLSLVAVALLAVVAAALGSSSRVVQAAPVNIDLVAVGAQENPPVSGPGSAIVHLTFDRDTRVLTYAVTVNGLSQDFITASHIHRGAVGVNGPIIYPLSLVPFTQISGSITLTPDDVKDLDAGNLYVNVHSTVNPGGFARAQIPAGAAGGAAATPTKAPGTVTPPNTGDAGLADRSNAMAPALFLALAGAIGAGATTVVVRRTR
jgi:hypothetical protein